MFSVIFCFTLALACDTDKNLTPDLILTSPRYEEAQSNLSESVTSLCFIDDKNGFAAGYGIIYKTTDRGLTWESFNIANLPFRSIYFLNSNVGFAVGGQSGCSGTNCVPPGSIVYKTTDSGESWSELNIPYQWSELNSVFFIDENIGFAVGGLQIKTSNGGQTWEQFGFEYQGAMTKIKFMNKQMGISAGLFGNIFRTTDQGKNWTKSNTESDGHIYDFCFVDNNIGFASGQKEIMRTTDGGQTWHIIEGSPSEIFFIQFANEKEGIAIGKGHYTGGDFGSWTTALFRTNNGGMTWAKEDNVELSSSAYFFDSKNGYSIASNKTFRIKYD